MAAAALDWTAFEGAGVDEEAGTLYVKNGNAASSTFCANSFAVILVSCFAPFEIVVTVAVAADLALSEGAHCADSGISGALTAVGLKAGDAGWTTGIVKVPKLIVGSEEPKSDELEGFEGVPKDGRPPSVGAGRGSVFFGSSTGFFGASGCVAWGCCPNADPDAVVFRA